MKDNLSMTYAYKIYCKTWDNDNWKQSTEEEVLGIISREIEWKSG